MNAAALQERFAVPGMLGFEDTPSGLVLAHVTTLHAEATLCLQGAHLMHWRPAGHQPVLFLSPRNELKRGKAIRGGVPIIFPWFGPRRDTGAGPQHGFARTSDWELAFAALAGDDMHLTFALGPSDLSRSFGFDRFRVACRIVVGRTLTLELTVANDSAAADSPLAPFVFEDAFHAYYAVADVETATITGLAGAEFLDKRDDGRRKLQSPGAMILTGSTDRAYLNTTATCSIDDPAAGRRIVVEKAGSHSTVVWNPWAELTAAMADMEPDGWRRMICLETANVAGNAIALQPGETHTTRAVVSVEDFG
jgi:glucose-6-phosphate 1-epimerase